MSLSRDHFCHLIPHSGSMCLIDRILDWDETTIRCSTSTHRSPDNPLSEGGCLHAVCGIEYAAQAAALHGGLLAERAGKPAAPGVLAAIRQVRMRVHRLDDLPDDLVIAADCQWADAGGLLYDFTVDAGLERVLDGRLAVILNPASAR